MLFNWPCCKFEYKINLYEAEKNEMKKINNKNKNLALIKFIIRTISPNKFNVKGPPKFAMHIKNQNNEILGNKFKNALLSIIIRECLRS